jgi:hypothetical protein
MRDVYQNIFERYPTLTAFEAIAAQEAAMVGTLKGIFAKYRLSFPADTRISAAKSVANAVTAISMADAVAIKLEQATATLMTSLLQTTRNTAVLAVEALIKKTSLGSHTSAFAAEQSSIFPPAPTTSGERVVSFTPSQTAAMLLAFLRDESVDVIELNGTYQLPYMVINIDRKRPVVVRPAAGAAVVLLGTKTWGSSQFEFGDGGTAGNITMQGFIFDGHILKQQGIIQATNCHDIAVNDMVVRNCRADGTYAQPYHAWAVYLSATATTFPMNFTANGWTIEATARGMSALTVSGGDHINVSGWVVSNAYYAVYASSNRGPLTDFILDGWTISGTGGSTWGSPNVSVAIENSSGRFSNMHAVSSGVLLNMGTPKMADGGGNSLQVPVPSSSVRLMGGSNREANRV